MIAFSEFFRDFVCFEKCVSYLSEAAVEDDAMSSVSSHGVAKPVANLEDMRRVLRQDSGTGRRKRREHKPQKVGEALRQEAKRQRRELKKRGVPLLSWLQPKPPPLPDPQSKRQQRAYRDVVGSRGARGNGK